MIIIAFFMWIVPLAMTLAVEIPVAAAFGLGRRGMRAVALINVITNPALNFIVMVLYGFGIGYVYDPDVGRAATAWYFYYLFLALETVVVVVEWRLLVWALRGSSFSSRRLLVTSLVMNATSCLLGLGLASQWSLS